MFPTSKWELRGSFLIVSMGAFCGSEAFAQLGVFGVIRIGFGDNAFECVQSTIDLSELGTVGDADELFAGRLDDVPMVSWVDVEGDAWYDDGFLAQELFEHDQSAVERRGEISKAVGGRKKRRDQ